jgi:L-threonylcarbamoyladenylate synthase
VAASKLFSAIHAFEKDKNVEEIFALKIEEEGIGKAIMDKLRKAAHHYIVE